MFSFLKQSLGAPKRVTRSFVAFLIAFLVFSGANTFDQFFWTIAVSPFAVFLIILGFNTAIMMRDRSGYVFFGGLVAWITLPVTMNAASFYVGELGFERVARWMYDLRFMSVVIAVFIALGLTIVWGCFCAALMKISARFGGNITAGAPPTGPADPGRPSLADRSSDDSDHGFGAIRRMVVALATR